MRKGRDAACQLLFGSPGPNKGALTDCGKKLVMLGRLLNESVIPYLECITQDMIIKRELAAALLTAKKRVLKLMQTLVVASTTAAVTSSLGTGTGTGTAGVVSQVSSSGTALFHIAELVQS